MIENIAINPYIIKPIGYENATLKSVDEGTAFSIIIVCSNI